MMNVGMIMSIVAASLALGACKQSGSPPDLLKTQRDTLNQAKALDDQLQQRTQEQMRAMEDSQN